MQRLGVRLPVGDTLKHIHMKFACFLSDEMAEKECLGGKGSIRNQDVCVLPELCQSC